MNRRNSRVRAQFWLLLVLLAGCDGPAPAPVPVAVTPVVKRVVQQRQSTARVSPLPEQYNFSEKRDPFRAQLVAERGKVAPQRLTAKQLPIERYEVGQFKVLGIVTGLSEARALVQDPTGKTYVVKSGSVMGPHSGRVQVIRAGVIEVLEQYRDEGGKVRSRVERVGLPRKE